MKWSRHAASLARGVQPVLVDRFTSPLLDRPGYKPIREHSLLEMQRELPADLIQDFSDKNRLEEKMPLELRERLPWHPVECEELEAIMARAGRYRLGGWDRFHERFSKALGIWEMSRDGFNRAGDLATAYVRSICGGWCGTSQTNAMEKADGDWRVRTFLMPTVA